MIKFSELHGRRELHAYLLHESNKFSPGQVLVHDKCRGLFGDYKRLNEVDQGQASCSPKKQKLRSASGEFNWKETVSSVKALKYLMTDILIEIKIHELYEQFHCMTICSQSVMGKTSKRSLRKLHRSCDCRSSSSQIRPCTLLSQQGLQV